MTVLDGASGPGGTVLGIDVGGSKTHGVRVRAGVVVGEATTRSANVSSTGIVEATAQIDLLLERLGIDGVDAVCVGAAGAAATRNELLALVQARLPGIPVSVVHDTELVLAAAELRSGAVVISGTGSSAWGRGPTGEEVHAGGWGYLLGDDGGAYGVVRDAIRHAMHRTDSGLAPDALTVELMRATSASHPAELLDRFYQPSSRREWASKAVPVLEFAEAGDAAALAVVDHAASELVEAVSRVCRRLGIAGPVVLAGGLLVHQPLLQQKVRQQLELVGISDITVLLRDPVHGAASLAQELLATHAV